MDFRQPGADYIRSANWIWSCREVLPGSTSYFRKEVSLPQTPVSITVLTSAHNYLKYYINGNIITGYVSPAPACIPENIHYLSYTFTADQLDALFDTDTTLFCFAAAVHYTGHSGTNYVNAVPAFWTEIRLHFPDGTQQFIHSDSTWSALEDTPYANGAPPMNKRKTGAQLDYDARKLPDPLSWTRFGFTEGNGWHNACPAASETAFWKMRSQKIPEGTIHANLTPTPIAKQRVGWQVFDAGRIVSGWVNIRAGAPKGTRICIRYSEYLDYDVVSHAVGSLRQLSDTYCDYYTFSGEGNESFAADFGYRAFRYFEIVGMPHLLQADQVTVQWASTAMEQTAFFSSSDAFLSKLYQACINTQINNVIGMAVDCPHREQAQYLADAQLQYALLSYAFREYPQVSYKTLTDFASSQKANGRFLFTAPTEEYAVMPSIQEWDLRYTAILYDYWLYSQDLEAVTQFYENAARNAKYYLSMLDGEGLLKDEPGAWNISDHPVIKGVLDDPGCDFHPTAANLLLFDTVNKLSILADVLCKSKDSAYWSSTTSGLKTAINSILLDRASGLYYGHSGSIKTNPGITAMAINVGVSESRFLSKQLDALVQAKPTETSVVLTFELLQAVSRHGTWQQKQYIYDRLVASWGPMIEKGYKTVWEGFLDQSSHTHAWSGYPAWIMLKDFAGIQFHGSKNTDIHLVPFLPNGVSGIQATMIIPGRDNSITVTLENDRGYRLTVVPPKNEQILVAVPRGGFKSCTVTANGYPVYAKGRVYSVPGIIYDSEDNTYIRFKVSADCAVTFHSAEANMLTHTMNGTI